MNSDVIPKHKVIIIGDMDVGKTCLVTVFKEESANHDWSKIKTTIGADLVYKSIQINKKDIDKYIPSNISKDISINTDMRVELNLWDTAGQERYKSLASQYIREAGAIILVFSLDNVKSLENIRKRLDDVKKMAGYPMNPEPLVMLVGTKLDTLFNDGEEIKIGKALQIFFNKNHDAEDAYNSIKEYWKQDRVNGIQQILLTSSYKNMNIQRTFKILATHLYVRSMYGNHYNGKSKNKSINYNVTPSHGKNIKENNNIFTIDHSNFETIDLNEDSGDNKTFCCQ